MICPSFPFTKQCHSRPQLLHSTVLATVLMIPTSPRSLFIYSFNSAQRLHSLKKEKWLKRKRQKKRDATSNAWCCHYLRG